MSEVWELGKQTSYFNGTLRKARLEKGLKQSDVAERVGISGSAYSHYETMRVVPDKIVANKIAKVLGKSVEQLFPFTFLRMLKDENLGMVEYGKMEVKELERYAEEQGHLLEENTNPEVQVAKQLCRERLAVRMKKLSEREQKVLNLAFGLDGQEPLSNTELGEYFQVSPERARQIKQHALNKLKKDSQLRKLATGLYVSEQKNITWDDIL